MSYHKAPAWGWELSLVSGFKLEPSGKIHSNRIPLLAPLQIISRPLWPSSVFEMHHLVWRTELSVSESYK